MDKIPLTQILIYIYIPNQIMVVNLKMAKKMWFGDQWHVDLLVPLYGMIVIQYLFMQCP